MFDFSIFLIYVVLKGSVVAVRTADKFAPNQSHRFLGICIERFNEGLWTKFTLRNVIEKTAVEIQYELYNPTIQSIEVLLLEKRLDRNLLYLRDAPLDESRFPFDMSRIPYNPSDPVPINDKKVCFYHNNIGKFYLLVVISCYLSYLFVAVVIHFEKTC
ncbi:unnamed protein product [Schistosoma mattheei]|uniref:Large ribosomal subunit protein bL19m n=1 Tax=Schistosoma mattheei TaxID=31246 RepID=A0A183NIK8_9TREM|nr:unnamed protein product [Schistosoma mattheei]